MSKVYFTKDLSQEGLIKIYQALNPKLEGKIGVKIHSGEKGNQNFLRPEFMKKLVDLLDGTIIECNTAYDGERNTNEKHLALLEKHGWNKLYKVDLLDEDGEMELNVLNGKHLKTNYVGSHLASYDSILVLSHFKGHPMGGFGGALKNISIGLASSHGKAVIHGAGDQDAIWTADHDSFLESMSEAASSIMDYKKDKIAFINVMKNMSVDCDCCSEAQDPKIKDIGILASLDPVALDKACLDLVYKSEDPGKKDLIERIESRNGSLTVKHAARLGVGSLDYELINID